MRGIQPLRLKNYKNISNTLTDFGGCNHLKTDTIEKIALQLMDKNDTKAKEIINSEYPFEVFKRSKRGVTDKIRLSSA